MDVETCLSYIGGYVNREYSSSNATFKQAIKDLCKSSKVPSVPKWNIAIGGKSANRYDDYIRAFRYYWKVRNGSVGFSPMKNLFINSNDNVLHTKPSRGCRTKLMQ